MLASAAFPRGAIAAEERLLLVPGLSLAIGARGGLALNRAPGGLQTLPWVLYLDAVTLSAAPVAALRGRHLPPAPAPAVRRLPWSRALLLAAAVATAVGAVGLGRAGVAEQPGPAVTQLWLLPAAQPADTVSIGLPSGEPAPASYRLVLTLDQRPLQEWQINLRPGETWTASAALPGGRPAGARVAATLYRADAPQTVYRQVRLGSN